MSFISRCNPLRPVPKGASAVRNIWGLLSWLSWTLLIVGASSCAHNPAQSWDQANLKRHDIGCPTAIWVAPGGNLEQC